MNEYHEEYKDYYIKPHSLNPKCYVVVTVGKGGKVPDMLSGMYTSKGLAKFDIDKYLETRKKKETLNGETVEKGGSK